MNGKYRVYDKQEKRYVTDEWMWVIRPDGTLAYVDYDDVIGYLDAVAEYSTGLHDKNGREIFEGDILGGQCELVDLRGNPTGHYAESRHVVEWSSDDAGFITRQTYESRNPEFYSERRPRGTLKICAKYYPVIGNVHDTPKRGQHDD